LTRSRLFVCSGAKVTTSDPLAKGRYRVEFDSIGPKSNVHISFENVAKVFQQDVSPRLIDFLEIAAYVFSADCSTARGTEWADNNSTEPWTRDLAFVIPVRHPEFWEAPQIKGLLEEVLNFLSNDIYSFHFELLKQDRVDQQYFEFGERNDWPFGRPERVVMFSGGLDSLSGAVEAASAGTKSVLVSHRSAPMLDARQRKLFADLQQRFPNQFIHVPVWINKAGTFNREPTQRPVFSLLRFRNSGRPVSSGRGCPFLREWHCQSEPAHCSGSNSRAGIAYHSSHSPSLTGISLCRSDGAHFRRR
jgi:hypothetical protein